MITVLACTLCVMIMIILFVAISFINFCFHMHSLSFYFGPNYVELLATLEKTIAPLSNHFIDSTLIQFQRSFEGIAMQVHIFLPNFNELLVCVVKQFNFPFKPKFTQKELKSLFGLLLQIQIYTRNIKKSVYAFPPRTKPKRGES